MFYNSVKNLLENCTRPENYNFEFEGFEFVCNYIHLKAIPRYFTYRATAPDRRKSPYAAGAAFAREIQESGKYRQLADCDGSVKGGNRELVHDVYSKLWGWKESDGTFGNIEGEKFKCQFGGDTMNSVQTVLNDIAKEIIGPKEHKRLFNKKIERGSKGFGIDYFVELYADPECSEELIAVLDSVEGLSEYVDAYHTIGNFVLVPGGFNRDRGFNGGKAGITQDYWDRSLQYLKDSGWKDNFNCGGDNLEDYYRYINYFFLWDYVNTDGDHIPLLKKETNDLEDKEKFLKKVIQLIKRRGCFMVAMLRLQQALDTDAYNELRDSIFLEDNAVYKNYEGIFKKMEEHLKDNITNEIKKLLSEAEKQIRGMGGLEDRSSQLSGQISCW